MGNPPGKKLHLKHLTCGGKISYHTARSDSKTTANLSCSFCKFIMKLTAFITFFNWRKKENKSNYSKINLCRCDSIGPFCEDRQSHFNHLRKDKITEC